MAKKQIVELTPTPTHAPTHANSDLLDETINNLCIIKREIKHLEKLLEEKKKQAEPLVNILLKNGGKKFSRKWGTLTQVTKENLQITDNSKIAFEIGIDTYITNSKISVTALKELRGILFINKMISEKVIVQGEPTLYFLYKEPK